MNIWSLQQTASTLQLCSASDRITQNTGVGVQDFQTLRQIVFFRLVVAKVPAVKRNRLKGHLHQCKVLGEMT